MFVCLVAVCVVCLWTGFINVRMRLEIRSLCLQLAELEQGSHMELTVLSRQKALLTLCRAMNRVLAFRDRAHVQYEASQKQMHVFIQMYTHAHTDNTHNGKCQRRKIKFGLHEDKNQNKACGG